MVERFFRDISENRLRRGVFTSVPELVMAIDSMALYEIEWVQRPQGGGKRRARRPCQTAHARGEQRPLLPNKKGLACCAALYYD